MMILARTFFVAIFSVFLGGNALADRPSYCNPPGSGVREILPECNQQVSRSPASPIGNPQLLPTPLVLRAAACDVANAALASRGNKLSIDKLNFAIEIDYKQVTTVTNSGNVGISGISPFEGITLGASGESSGGRSYTTEHNYFHQPATPADLVTRHCVDTGNKGGRRTAAYGRWLRGLSNDVSIYRQGVLGAGKVSYATEFGATNSVKSGFNIQFLIALGASRETSYERSQSLRVTWGKLD